MTLKNEPTAIFTTDLHLVTDPSAEYRWQFLHWLQNQLVDNDIDRLFILGDITDKKDNHPAQLVNRMVEAIESLASVADVYIIQGNHDFIEPTCPFFGFLDSLDGVFFINKPMTVNIGTAKYKLLPFSRHPERDWQGMDFSGYDRILTHITVARSITSNGTQMDGIAADIFGDTPVYSGDIHVPQKIGEHFEYVGSPYHVHFGDKFLPRCIMHKDGKRTDLYFQSPKRLSVTLRNPSQLHDLNLVEYDQLKVKLKLPKSQLVRWETMREEVITTCKEMGVELHGLELEAPKREQPLGKEQTSVPTKVSDKERLQAFASQEKLGAYTLQVGEKLLNE